MTKVKYERSGGEAILGSLLSHRSKGLIGRTGLRQWRPAKARAIQTAHLDVHVRNVTRDLVCCAVMQLWRVVPNAGKG